MKNRVSVALALFLFAIVGCKGPRGDAGPTGATGSPGTPGGLPDGVLYSGTATNNAFLVSIPRLDVSQGDLVIVYACTNVNTLCQPLNLYLPTLPGNLAYLESPGQVQLDNLVAASLPNYFITVIFRH